MTDNIAFEPASGRERFAAAAVVVALALSIALEAPFAHDAWPVVLAAVPTVATIEIIAWALSAWALFAQFRLRHYAPLAVLATGFASACAMTIASFATFPGMFVPANSLFANGQSSLWLYALRGVMFSSFVLLYVLAEHRERRRPGSASALVMPVAYTAVAIVIANVTLAVLGANALPPLAAATGEYTPLFSFAVIPFDLAATGVAAAVVAIAGRGTRVPLWLFVCLAAAFTEIVVSRVLGVARFSGGWYVARIDGIVQPAIFVFVAISQFGASLGRAQKTGDRARELSKILADATRPNVEIPQMLKSVAQEFGYDVAYLARRTGEGMLVEVGVGTSLAPAPGKQFAINASTEQTITNARAVYDVTSPDQLAGFGVPGPPGSAWGALCVIPVFLANDFYGIVGLGNTELRAAPLSQIERDFVSVVGVLVGNAIERREHGRHLDSLAYYDSLTGLPNRVLLMDRIATSIAAAERYGHRVAIHFLDLDGFKPINDQHGHAIGDVVLKEIGRRLAKTIRQSDAVARYGGDEFVVLQSVVTDVANVTDLSARLAAAFTDPVNIGGLKLQCGASMGVAIFPDHGREPLMLISRADEEQYRVKDARRAARRTGP